MKEWDKQHIKVSKEGDALLRLQFNRPTFLRVLFTDLSKAGLFLLFTWVLFAVIDITFLFWLSAVFGILFIIRQARMRKGVGEYLLIDKNKGIIQAENRKDMTIRNIKAVRVTILTDDDGNETTYALSLRTYNPNKPYRIDLVDNKEEAWSAAKMISGFLTIPMQTKKEDKISEVSL